MDLFVINRYNETKEDVDIADQETNQLEKLKKLIEERKNAYTKTKTPNVITLKEHKEVNTFKVVVKEEKGIEVELDEPVAKKPTREKVERPSHEFKVLGINDFERKAKNIQEKRARKRDPNFTTEEKALLTRLVFHKKHIVASKLIDGKSVAKKKEAWELITREFNREPYVHKRDVMILKRAWDNLKAATRKTHSAERRSIAKTGGPLDSPQTAQDGLEEADPLHCEILDPYNSDGIAHQDESTELSEGDYFQNAEVADEPSLPVGESHTDSEDKDDKVEDIVKPTGAHSRKASDYIHKEGALRIKALESKTKIDLEILHTKVSRVLPYWLSHPYNVSTDLQNLDCDIDSQNWLHGTLKSTLLSEGVTHLFPVQTQVVPFILKEHKVPYPFQPHDICVSAPTGSGKTLSFVLPIVQILMNEIGCEVKALVVLPVQELAAQVAKVFKRYCTKTNLRVALLGGSVPLHQEQQNIVRYTESSGWMSDVDIIVCTAGRLVEHLQNTEGFSLRHLKFLVIDEADRIMDQIQNDWLYHVDRNIKSGNELMSGRVSTLNWHTLNEQRAPPHKLLFSATLSQDPEKLEQWGLFQPKLFSAAPITDFEGEDQIRLYATPAELKENYVSCEAENKPLVLYHFLVDQKWDKVLCFTNAAEAAHRLAVLLKTWGGNKLRVAELSASLDRPTRESVLKKFTQSEINILIGTDALARGIDVPDCNYVVSYDPPRNIKTYIHRVGRTSRAGRAGQAVTILLPNQINPFKDILKSGGKAEIPAINIQPEILSQLSESYEYAIQETKKLIHTEINTKVQKSVQLKRRFKSKSQKQRRNK